MRVGALALAVCLTACSSQYEMNERNAERDRVECAAKGGAQVVGSQTCFHLDSVIPMTTPREVSNDKH